MSLKACATPRTVGGFSSLVQLDSTVRDEYQAGSPLSECCIYVLENKLYRPLHFCSVVHWGEARAALGTGIDPVGKISPVSAVETQGS